MAKKVTIIGGSGFVGTYLSELLTESKKEFEIIDTKLSKKFPFKCKIADVRDKKSLGQAIEGDIIINLAAVHRDDVRDKSSYYSTNVEGARNIVSICIEKGIDKIIFASTVAVYGFADRGTDETGRIEPYNDYGRSKHKAEEIFRKWQRDTGASLFIVRPTVIFGEGNRGNVYNLFSQIQSGKFLMIGHGNNKKSMAYVRNVAAYLLHCINNNKNYELINYVDSPDLTMNELVGFARNMLKGKVGVGFRLPFWFGLILGYMGDLLMSVTSISVPISSIRVKKFASSSEFSAKKLKSSSFKAPFSIMEGIDLTLHNDFISPSPDRIIFNVEKD